MTRWERTYKRENKSSRRFTIGVPKTMKNLVEKVVMMHERGKFTCQSPTPRTFQVEDSPRTPTCPRFDVVCLIENHTKPFDCTT